ncbi:Mth938-like domain-containing protein [Aliiroseovarius sp. S1339]|uniref:Mth938-like domain-containing protein n=1 Tax=Aliiroseovarius sp. S1339 TaxID=2936990 RepID=UPI0020C00897|nr:Mth938-like domain-containing protein [Aliiroseovarius sp. S1339]MCK8464763.1 Mth938-like domain-containing protein [Aliiroseovarius sp. S1339]
MEFHEVKYNNAQPVDGYGPGFFRVADEVIQGGVLVTADAAIKWGGPDELAPLLALAGKVDVLLYGTGADPAHLPADLQEALEEVGVAVEAMASAPACRTYNVLLAEGRRIALAALPV